MEAGRTVTRTVDLDVDLDAAWRLVGTAAGLASWLGRDVEVDVEVGGALRLHDDDGTARTGTVTEVRPGRALSFHWAGEGDDDPSAVTVSVDEGDDGRARVTVTEVVASTGGRAVACLDAGAAWDDRLLGLELGALVAAPAFAALA